MDTTIFSSLLHVFIEPSKLMAIAVEAARRLEKRRSQVVVGILEYAAKMWNSLTASVAKIIANLWTTSTSPSEGEAVGVANIVDVSPQVAEAQPRDQGVAAENHRHGDDGPHDVVGAAENAPEASAARGNGTANRGNAHHRGNNSKKARKYRAGYAARGVSGESRNTG